MKMLLALLATTGVVSFKDAGKIKSWDAWDDQHKPAEKKTVLDREKPCVTWKRLNELDYGLKEIGRLATRTSQEIKSSQWSVGCETMDRDYAEWDSFKELLPMLGVKHARFFSGWAKTEQEKGVYDFAWLDPHIRECAAMGIKPWVCIAYGNPVYGSDFRLGMRVKQVTGNAEAFAAWLRYTKALVARYRDVVDEWEVWNEPFGQAEEYAELFYRTARAIREVQLESRIYCTAITMGADMRKSDYAVVLEKLKRENALDLANRFIYHPYDANPDATYEPRKEQTIWQKAMPLRRFVKSYSPAFDIIQGEVGCPAQLEFAHALSGIEWTEYSQAKWELRRAIGDAAHEIPSSVFTMIDLQYTFMLQSFGMVRSNTLKEFVYRRPKWYAMRNVYSLFDDDTRPAGLATNAQVKIVRRADPRDAADRVLTRASFSRFGKALHLFWYSDSRPSNRLEFDRVELRLPGELASPVWVEMITGRICEIERENVRVDCGETILSDVPMWDSPVLLTDRASVGFESPFTAQCRGRKPLVVNGDNDHYYKAGPMQHFLPLKDRVTREGPRNYLDVISSGGKVTHYFACAVGQRANYDSSVCDPIWRAIDEATTRGEPPNEWPVNAKKMHDLGVDPIAEWCAYGSQKGVSVWISQRMNDVHHVHLPWNMRTNRFWYDHPELHRSHGVDKALLAGNWTDEALNYAFPEVREFEFAIFRELVDRYDAEGFELDFMRFWRHLTPGREREEAPILTEFIRRCRDYTRAKAAERGHAILLSTRVPSDYQAALAFGFDPETWAREDLVDMIAVANFWAAEDFDFRFDEWKKRISAANPRVTLLPCACDNVSSGASKVCTTTLGALNGWADNAYSLGADGLYVFNAAYMPDDVQRELYGPGLDPQALSDSERRHVVTYHDCVPKGMPDGRQLPVRMATGGRVNVRIGSLPEGRRTVNVVVAGKALEVKDGGVSLNGIGLVGIAKQTEDLSRYGQAEVAWTLTFPASAAKAGGNVVVFEPGVGRGDVTWVEVVVPSVR